MVFTDVTTNSLVLTSYFGDTYFLHLEGKHTTDNMKHWVTFQKTLTVKAATMITSNFSTIMSVKTQQSVFIKITPYLLRVTVNL